MGLLDIFNELNISSNEFTYLRIADILLFKGLQFSGAKRNVYITALKLMLLIKMIADTSESVIKKNISLLSGSEIDSVELLDMKNNVVDIDDLLAFREKIDIFLLKYKF